MTTNFISFGNYIVQSLLAPLSDLSFLLFFWFTFKQRKKPSPIGHLGLQYVFNKFWINVGKTWWFVETRPWARGLGDGGSQGRGCGAVQQASADKPWGLAWDYAHVKPPIEHGESAKKLPMRRVPGPRGESKNWPFSTALLHDCPFMGQWWAIRKPNPGVYLTNY